MLRLAPPPRSLQTVLTELDNTCKCNSTLRYGLSCFPEMSDGHLQANARGGVSEETTSQLYALLIWHLQANARGGVSGETTSQLYALLL